MQCPIIFVHKGQAAHLDFAVRQAKKICPNHSIVLLGDRANRRTQYVDQHVDLTDYFRGANDFEAIYHHHSVNAEPFELFCFQRWFAIQEWMATNNVKSSWAMDSDILVFRDLTEAEKALQSCDLACAANSGHIVYIRNRSGIDRYCDRAMQIYQRPDILQQYLHEATKVEHWVGISDMNVFHDLFIHDEGTTSLLELSDGTAFDTRIQATNLYSGDEFKTIRWIDGVPHGLSLETGKWTKFNCLHFQGSAKKKMKEFLVAPDLRLGLIRGFHELSSLRRRIHRKLKIHKNAA